MAKFLGIIALFFMVIGLIPLLGILNYLAVFFAVLGLIFGAIPDQANGIVLNGVVLTISLIRLFLGGGII